MKAIGHVTEATSVAFAPDGTAFLALKTGIIKSFDYNSGTGTFEHWTTATNFADLTTNVNNYWDRGLTGIALDPQFGTAGHNFVYVNYTYNRDPRDATPVVPKWGVPGQQYDECPAPATTDPPRAGCVVMMRVTRLTAVKNALGWEMTGPETQLLASGCFQFGSHASGDVAFGPDGKLYASAGEGASFDTMDYGQYANPCADPGDEGGSLRSQDYRSASDALGVDGTIVKMDPVTGFTPSQATANSWLVAYGQRNPWRLTFRQGTNELWSGDVGGSEWEEVNRIPDVTQVTSPINRGWPCYEGSFTGSQVQQGWNSLDKPLCETLYPQGLSAVSAPYFSYQTRGPLLTPGEDCENQTSSVSGIAFGSASSNYPAQYKGAMFFSDYARSCVWMLGKKPNGDPDPTVIHPFVQDAETPVDLVAGPGGDLYYVDYGLDDLGVPTENAAGVHRIVYTGSNAAPTARIVATPTSGPAPLTVSFDGTTSTDPDGDTLSYAWDLDANGSYETPGPTPSKQYAVGTYNVGLRVDDGHGHTSTATQQIQAGNSAPVLGTVIACPDADLVGRADDQLLGDGHRRPAGSPSSLGVLVEPGHPALPRRRVPHAQPHHLPGGLVRELPGTRPRVPLAPPADGHRHRQRRTHRLAHGAAQPEVGGAVVRERAHRRHGHRQRRTTTRRRTPRPSSRARGSPSPQRRPRVPAAPSRRSPPGRTAGPAPTRSPRPRPRRPTPRRTRFPTRIRRRP